MQSSLSFRLDPIPSTSMRSTAYPPKALRTPTRLLMPLIPILLLRLQQKMNLHLNVSSVFPRRVRSFSCLAVIWLRAANVPSTWLSLVPEVPLPIQKRNLLRLRRTTRTTLGIRRRLRLKRKAQEPQLTLSLPRLKLSTEGSEGPRGGFALYADSVRFTTILLSPRTDTPLDSLHVSPQNYDDSSPKGRY